MMLKNFYDFEIKKIKGIIKEKGARKVGLQLPEGLRIFATEIAEEISKWSGGEVKLEVIISGNSCYGACDVDEKLKSLVDVLFHFGHAEVDFFKKEAVTRKIFFIEVRSKIDVKRAMKKAIEKMKGEKIGLIATVQHVHALEEVKDLLRNFGKQAIIKKENREKSRIKYDGQVLGCDLSSAIIDCDEILFIGSGSFHPLGVALYVGKRVIAADPFTTQINIFEPEEIRKKRYMVIERAIDAKSFGILVGMKTGQLDMEKAIYLKRKAIEKGLDAYLIAMNEIKEEKLVGFRVDAFVNSACPRLFEDFFSFKKPFLSVQEFEVVLGERSWEDVFSL